MSVSRYFSEVALYTILYFVLSSYYIKITTLLFVVIYIYQLYFLLKRSKYNGQAEYFSFNYLFFVMLSIITYLVPIFYLFGLDDLIIDISPASYESQYIPKSLYITSIAVSSYTFGFTKREKYIEVEPDNILLSSIQRNLHVAKIIAFIALVFFVYQFSLSYQSGMMDVEGFVVILVSVSLIYSISIVGYSNLLYNYGLIQFILHNRFILGIAAIVVIAMLSIGDRFFPLLILCSSAFIINHFVYKISLKRFLFLIFFGASVMFFISFTRFSDSKSFDSTIARYESISNPAIVFQDVIPVNLDYYLGLHYVDQKGYFSPDRIIVFLLKPVPFLPSFLTLHYFDGNVTTGDLITQYNKNITNVGSSEQGLGTHCIVDIYMSWGVLGVIILFMLMGIVVGRCYNRLNSIYALLIYSALVAGAIYIPRESLFSTYRIAIWLVILAFIITKKRDSSTR